MSDDVVVAAGEDGPAAPDPMSVVGAAGGGVEVGPPTATTVRNALLAVALVPVWAGVELAASAGGAPVAFAGFAGAHLLAAGVACTAIAAAVPQFLAVWSAVPLEHPRAATTAAPLVAVGAVGLAGTLLAGAPGLAALGGLALAVGLWTLAGSTAGTLAAARPWDATERLLAAGVAALAVGAVLGLALGTDYAVGVFPVAGVDRVAAASTHVTLVVLGGVVSVAYGGLAQLSGMLTGAPTDARRQTLLRAASVGHPLGAGALAAGRLAGSEPVALAGAGLVVACGLALAAVLAGRLRAERDPSAATLRYRLVAVGLLAWALSAGRAWLANPLARPAVLGGALAERALFATLLVLVVGSLYHVVPFLVWVERYADRLGLDPVPDVETLCDARLERAERWLTAGGALAWLAGTAAGVDPLATVGAAGLLAGGGLAVLALAGVVAGHGPWSGRTLVAGGIRPSKDSEP